MPKIAVNGCNYYYEILGEGEDTLMLSHGLLFSGKLFQKQVAYFKDRYKVVVYDHRGQGQSEVTDSGYDMDQLFEDAAGLIETLNLGRVHFGGLSMGGFVGLRLAARRPDLVKSLILMGTSAEKEPHVIKYNILKMIFRFFGIKPVLNTLLNLMFGKKFLSDPSKKDEVEKWRNDLIKLDTSILKAVTGVIERKGVEEELANIMCPTLILVGSEDITTEPSKAEFLHSKIPNSTLKTIEGSGHLICIEEPDLLNREIERFLKP